MQGTLNQLREARTGFPCGSVVKNLPANAGDARDTGSIPGLYRSPGEGNGNPLQYSCLGNSTGRGAWWATVHGVAKSPTPLPFPPSLPHHFSLEVFLSHKGLVGLTVMPAWLLWWERWWGEGGGNKSDSENRLKFKMQLEIRPGANSLNDWWVNLVIKSTYFLYIRLSPWE